jgi:hypothetical protein
MDSFFEGGGYQGAAKPFPLVLSHVKGSTGPFPDHLLTPRGRPRL